MTLVNAQSRAQQLPKLQYHNFFATWMNKHLEALIAAFLLRSYLLSSELGRKMFPPPKSQDLKITVM